MSNQKVKGSVLKSRLAFVENEFGRDGLEKVMEALEPEDRQALARVLPVAWLDFEVGKRLDDAIVRARNDHSSQRPRQLQFDAWPEASCRPDQGRPSSVACRLEEQHLDHAPAARLCTM